MYIIYVCICIYARACIFLYTHIDVQGTDTEIRTEVFSEQEGGDVTGKRHVRL